MLRIKPRPFTRACAPLALLFLSLILSRVLAKLSRLDLNLQPLAFTSGCRCCDRPRESPTMAKSRADARHLRGQKCRSPGKSCAGLRCGVRVALGSCYGFVWRSDGCVWGTEQHLPRGGKDREAGTCGHAPTRCGENKPARVPMYGTERKRGTEWSYICHTPGFS